jgi:hypothetical protein
MTRASRTGIGCLVVVALLVVFVLHLAHRGAERPAPSATPSPPVQPPPPERQEAALADPRLAPLIAEVERLEARQVETQAAHMRAVSAHSANEDCAAFERCMEAVPPASQSRPGEYSRGVRACKASKTESCRTAERALERARDENIATVSELQAARMRLERARGAEEVTP